MDHGQTDEGVKCWIISNEEDSEITIPMTDTVGTLLERLLKEWNMGGVVEIRNERNKKLGITNVLNVVNLKKCHFFFGKG